MKMRGIWIAIILIMCVGVLATSYTKEYVSTPASAESNVTAGAVDAAQEYAAAEAVIQPDASPRTRVAPLPDAALSGGSDVAVYQEGSMPDGSAAEAKITEVKVRLQELDEQIERNHAGGQDSTTNSLKAAAESERKLWETEMERILGILSERLTEPELEQLRQQQKDWLRNRESQAVALSQKTGGSALAELEYNLAQKDLTRDRAYELEAQYHDTLKEAE